MKGVDELVQGLSKVISDNEEDAVVFKGNNINIDDVKKAELVENDSKIAFIDGGNSVILSASNFCLQFIRVYAVVFQNNKKISDVKKEFFCLTKAVSENKYKNEFYGNEFLEEFSVDANDPTLKKGINKCEINEMGSVARRFAELKLAAEVDSSIVVLDGSIEASVVREKKYLENIDKTLVGLSKTNSVITEKGGSASALLLGRDFNYLRLDEKTYLVKLNESSSHVFQLEVNEKFDEVLSLLIRNSNDAVFPGYPYGLILVDQFARVSNKEKEYIRTILHGKTCKFKDYTNSKDAHSVLDNVSF